MGNEEIKETIDHGEAEDVSLGLGSMTKEVHKYPAVKTSWDKLITMHDAHHYALRHNAGMAIGFMQVLRILIPDYEKRTEALINFDRAIYYDNMANSEFMEGFKEGFNVHPFLRGSMIAGLLGDFGDESLLMCGRIHDYGPYRVEKELYTCPYDIVGSEYCRTTADGFEKLGDACADIIGGPKMEFNMIEALGCGDESCRVVCENREKYPMPPKERIIDTFGPIATADQITLTREEDRYEEPMYYRPESGGMYRNALNAEYTAEMMFNAGAPNPLVTMNVIPVLYTLEDQDQVNNVVKCVFEGCGKMEFLEFAAIEAIRDMLGVPADVKDGRVLGGLIKFQLECIRCDFEEQVFNEEEVIIDIDRVGLERMMPLLSDAYVSYWFGMSKTLVSARWACWEEKEGVPKDKLRIKIAKKVDKYC